MAYKPIKGFKIVFIRNNRMPAISFLILEVIKKITYIILCGLEHKKN